MPTLSVERLQEIGEEIFRSGGVPPPIAHEVTESLVLSNLLGVDSHGMVRVKNYCDGIKAGRIVPDAQPAIVRDNGVAVAMGGNKAFGQIAARRATELAIEKARQHAIGAVTFTDVVHIGRLGEYVAMIATQNMIGFMVTNGGRPGGLVAPFGSRQRVLGTNPIAFAIPAGSYPMLVADFSTSAVAEGRVRVAMRRNEVLPPGWIIDKAGRPSQTPSDLYDGGAILCFGEYKGFALSLLVEVLGGILTGGETPIFPGYDYLHNGVFLLAIDPLYFRPEQEYRSAVDTLFRAVKEALPAEGSNGVMLPGEPEQHRRATRSKEGIPIDDSTWQELQEIANAYGVIL